MAFSVVALLGLVSLGSCATLVEQVSEVPSGWTQLRDEVSPDQSLWLSFALREPNIAELRTRLVSGTSKHLSDEEARLIRQPDQQDVDAVQNWLAENGIKDARQENDWIHVRTTVAAAEPLLGMKLHRYEFENGQQALRTTDPCLGKVTPGCIRELYKLPPAGPSENSTIRLGIAGFLEEYANYADAAQFLDRLAPDVASTGYNFSVELINGGENPQDPSKSGLEAALDIQYALALAHPAQLTYYYTGGRGVKLGDDGKPLAGELVDNEPYLEFLEYLLAKPTDEMPHVLSFSYGDDELSVPRAYAERICNMMGILTARGTTILSSSGDGGARGSRRSNCVTPEGKKVTMAVFPATCPWVTSVGGRDAVDGYVERLDGHLEGYYNSSMRAVPDISAVASRFEIVVGGRVTYVDGTSASAPLLASLIAVADHERAKRGKDPVGWINQHLYGRQAKGVFQDTITGESTSCPFDGDGGPGGWLAVEGWDAVTGLGVPNDFSEFLKFLVAI
uniref:tripeptidyl-peptidase II n=1 Tax=Bionectria ochroleuca TaxID=29856 RepID=A0A0B7KLS8_BIOOC